MAVSALAPRMQSDAMRLQQVEAQLGVTSPARMEEGRGVLEHARAEQAERTRAEASGPAALPATEPLLHWTQIKIPPNPTSGTPQEMQAARKERQRVRRLYVAARLRAGE